jgi:hypothetical protein
VILMHAECTSTSRSNGAQISDRSGEL